MITEFNCNGAPIKREITAGGTPIWAVWEGEKLIRVLNPSEQMLVEAALTAATHHPQASSPLAAQAEGMPLTQEPKYGIRDNRLFNRASGEFIPLDEPVFIFRARDKLACQALTDYRFYCLDEQHRAAIAKRFIEFERFACDHPERMKFPDTGTAPTSCTGNEGG